MTARWLTRRRAVWIVLAAVAVFLAVDGFVAPFTAHDIRSPGAKAPRVSVYEQTPSLRWNPGPPSQSLGVVACFSGGRPCTASDVTAVYPGLEQADHTLYYVWAVCDAFYPAGGPGPIPTPSYNIEYLPGTHQLILHCHTTSCWLCIKLGGGRGIGPQPPFVLLAIDTSEIGPGTLAIVEEDRVEHLVGDWSSESTLATATIS